MSVTSTPDLLGVVRDMEPRVRAASDDIEQGRRIPPSLVTEMQQRGLFGMAIPADLGGQLTDPLTLFNVIEEASRIDGSFGWIIAIGSGTPGFIVPYLDAHTAREIFLGNGPVITGGTIAPRGKAVPVDGGFRLSGRWAFASGIEHCKWLIAGCFIIDKDGPRRGAGTKQGRWRTAPRCRFPGCGLPDP